LNKLFTYIFILFCCNTFANENIIDYTLKSKKINTKTVVNADNKNLTNKSFSIKNIAAENIDIVFELSVENIEYIIIYFQNNSYEKTDTFRKNTKISDRKFYDRDVVFEYTLPKNSTANVQIDILNTKPNVINDIFVWNKFEKINSTQTLEISKGVFYGIMFLFIVFCFILFRLIKEKNYLWFFIFLLFGTMYLLIKQNIAYEFLWSKYPEIDTFIKKIILVSYLIITLNFLRLFIVRRIPNFILNKYIKIILYVGIIIILVTLSIGFFSDFVKELLAIFQYIYIVICVICFIVSFIISYLKFEQKTMFYFILSFFISFSFFLFYPVPSTSKYITGINFKQIFTYSNAFLIAFVVSGTILLRVLQIIKSNKQMKQQVSLLHAQKNFAAITAQMNEKKRVGKELHDGIGILMATTKMKLSSIKTENIEEQKKIKEMLLQIDNTTQKIRKYSHNLLPPTLEKFGLETANNDIIEQYNNHHQNKIKYLAEINTKLNEVSKYIIYDIMNNLIKYFSTTNNYNIEINIKEISDNKNQIISITYSGNTINTNNIYIINVIKIIELLHGNLHQELINTFTHYLQLEIPIQEIE
jgi:signal transduction histidine kinase